MLHANRGITPVMGEVPGNLDVLQLAILLHGLQQHIDRQSILDSYAI